VLAFLGVALAFLGIAFFFLEAVLFCFFARVGISISLSLLLLLGVSAAGVPKVVALF
jgi:hypothetical protein